jgi:hypothetical protein
MQPCCGFRHLKIPSLSMPLIGHRPRALHAIGHMSRDWRSCPEIHEVLHPCGLGVLRRRHDHGGYIHRPERLIDIGVKQDSQSRGQLLAIGVVAGQREALQCEAVDERDDRTGAGIRIGSAGGT